MSDKIILIETITNIDDVIHSSKDPETKNILINKDHITSAGYVDYQVTPTAGRRFSWIRLSCGAYHELTPMSYSELKSMLKYTEV